MAELQRRFVAPRCLAEQVGGHDDVNWLARTIYRCEDARDGHIVR